jgi:hypothetical protein
MPAVTEPGKCSSSCGLRGGGLPYLWGRLLWYGRPKFLRWRLLAGDRPAMLFGVVLPGVGERNEPGCGCFTLFKDLWKFLSKVWPGLTQFYLQQIPEARRRRELEKYWAPQLAAGRRRCARSRCNGCPPK